MTSTKREHAKEAKENQHFHKILFASTIEKPNEDGNTVKQFKKAIIEPMFIQVLQANKNSRATRLMQSAIESMAAEMNFRKNRFASASSLELNCLINLSQQHYVRPDGNVSTRSSTQKVSKPTSDSIT
jgi:hypothetical protein